MDTQEQQARWLATSAGHLTHAVRAELGRLLVKNGGDRRKALAAGFAELATRKTLHATEAKELAAIMEMFFNAPDGQDPKLAERASTYFNVLTLDAGSSPAALAIASVISSFTSSTKGTGSRHAHAVSTGDAVFGGFGAVVGAGIGFGFGGPIGAGIGAVVGAAVGVCIEEG
jgi:hypothetical protein